MQLLMAGWWSRRGNHVRSLLLADKTNIDNAKVKVDPGNQRILIASLLVPVQAGVTAGARRTGKVRQGASLG